MNSIEREVNKKYRDAYYTRHKDRLNKQRRENKTKCDCGSVVRTDNFQIHMQSLKHQEYEFLKINDE